MKADAGVRLEKENGRGVDVNGHGSFRALERSGARGRKGASRGGKYATEERQRVEKGARISWFALVMRVVFGTVLLWLLLFTDIGRWGARAVYGSVSGMKGQLTSVFPVRGDGKYVYCPPCHLGTTAHPLLSRRYADTHTLTHIEREREREREMRSARARVNILREDKIKPYMSMHVPQTVFLFRL